MSETKQSFRHAMTHTMVTALVQHENRVSLARGDFFTQLVRPDQSYPDYYVFSIHINNLHSTLRFNLVEGSFIDVYMDGKLHKVHMSLDDLSIEKLSGLVTEWLDKFLPGPRREERT